MSLFSISNSSTASVQDRSSRAELAERIATSSSAKASGLTLSGIADAAVAGVSATVTFSGKALHAIESAGEAVVDGVEDAAVGAWHLVQDAAHEVEHAGEAVVDAVEDGADQVVDTVKTVGKEIGHYAAVALETVGEGLSEVASGTVMAAAAGGKTLLALL